MYRPSRLTASALLVVQLCSLDLYATNGNATAQKVQQQKTQVNKVNVASDKLADALKRKDFVSAKGHKVRFWQDGKSQWQASVTLVESGEDLILRVQGKDKALARLPQADLDQQKRMLRVVQGEDEKSSRVYVGSLDVEVFNPEADGSDVALMGENVTEGVVTFHKDMRRAMNGPEFRQALASQEFQELVRKALESVGVDEEPTDAELDAWIVEAQRRIQLPLSQPGFDEKVKELVESKAFQKQLEAAKAKMQLAIAAPEARKAIESVMDLEGSDSEVVKSQWRNPFPLKVSGRKIAAVAPMAIGFWLYSQLPMVAAGDYDRTGIDSRVSMAMIIAGFVLITIGGVGLLCKSRYPNNSRDNGCCRVNQPQKRVYTSLLGTGAFLEMVATVPWHTRDGNKTAVLGLLATSAILALLFSCVPCCCGEDGFCDGGCNGKKNFCEDALRAICPNRSQELVADEENGEK